MFHDGSLQSGISLAISQQKSVTCFVRDNSQESATWENEWLPSGELFSLLLQKSVVLRLEAGSTEAGFLAAFCPISDKPALVIIHNGQLREQLTSGVSREEFVARTRKALGAEDTSNNTASAETQSNSASDAQRLNDAETPPQPAAQPSAQTETPPVSSPPSAKSKGKQKAVDDEVKPVLPSSKAHQQSARDAVRKKKQEEQQELARIKARIEADKAERRAHAAALKAERERLSQSEQEQSSASIVSRKGTQAKEVNLNVRLFDGHTIRSSFPRSSTLEKVVRPWIDQEFAAKAETPNERHPPYIFKQIQAPLPSRELSTGEENEELGEIGLAPSATLVLIPVKGFTEAYSSTGGGIVSGAYNGVTGLVGGAMGLVGSTVGYVGSTLGSFVGYGSSPAQQDSQAPPAGRTLDGASEAPSTSGASGIRVRTLTDQREREPRTQHLYNGNQLNFEPNENDEDRN